MTIELGALSLPISVPRDEAIAQIRAIDQAAQGAGATFEKTSTMTAKMKESLELLSRAEDGLRAKLAQTNLSLAERKTVEERLAQATRARAEIFGSAATATVAAGEKETQSLQRTTRAMGVAEAQAVKMDAAMTAAAQRSARAMALTEISAYKMDAAMRAAAQSAAGSGSGSFVGSFSRVGIVTDQTSQGFSTLASRGARVGIAVAFGMEQLASGSEGGMRRALRAVASFGLAFGEKGLIISAIAVGTLALMDFFNKAEKRVEEFQRKLAQQANAGDFEGIRKQARDLLFGTPYKLDDEGKPVLEHGRNVLVGNSSRVPGAFSGSLADLRAQRNELLALQDNAPNLLAKSKIAQRIKDLDALRMPMEQRLLDLGSAGSNVRSQEAETQGKNDPLKVVGARAGDTSEERKRAIADEIAAVGGLVDANRARKQDIAGLVAVYADLREEFEKGGQSAERELELIDQMAEAGRLLTKTTTMHPELLPATVRGNLLARAGSALSGALGYQLSGSNPGNSVVGRDGKMLAIDAGDESTSIAKGGKQAIAAMERVAKEVLQAGERTDAMIERGIANTLGASIRNAFESAFDGNGVLGFIEAFGKTVLAGVGSTMEQLGEVYLEYGGIMEALSGLLPNPFTAGAAGIAIGLALIAMGGALGAVASHGGGGSRGGGGGGSSGHAGSGQIIDRGIINPANPLGNTTASGLTPAMANTSSQNAAGISPRGPVYVTVIGVNDATAQRQIQELIRNGNRRGNV